MKTLRDIRTIKPAFYPDPTIHAEFAAAACGLDFSEIDGGTGLLFTVSGKGRSASFGAGRCSSFPQNNATAATLANDKYLADQLMQRADIPTLGGQYFFLHQRHRAHRPPGHERDDAMTCLRALGGSAFVKPLNGSRGDFAQSVDTEAALNVYLDDVSRYHDAIIMQRIDAGTEYRVFVLDDEILYCVRKMPPTITGDGQRSIAELLASDEAQRRAHGISLAGASDTTSCNVVPAKGEQVTVPGRMNRSAGGSMVFAVPDGEQAVFAIAKAAVHALGLRVGAVDLFADSAEHSAVRVIEVNANPSIRFLEDSGRDDLILRIWQNTFRTVGVLDV